MHPLGWRQVPDSGTIGDRRAGQRRPNPRPKGKKMAQIETTTVQEIRLGLALKDLIDAWEGDEDLDAWVDEALAHIPGLAAGDDLIFSTAD